MNKCKMSTRFCTEIQIFSTKKTNYCPKEISIKSKFFLDMIKFPPGSKSLWLSRKIELKRKKFRQKIANSQLNDHPT